VKDKNKSAFKLEGLPRIYYINLDDQVNRKKYMEEQFAYWNITNYERISAHDGRGDNDLGECLKGLYPKSMSSGEVGCTISHLKAMKYWLDNTDESEDMLLIMEDDCDISCAANWGFTWKEFKSHLPYHFDVVQLAVINPGELHVKMHLRFVNDFSTACYLVRRHHAQKLVRLHCRGNKYKIDQEIKPRAVADDLIYNSGLTFAIPLFLYKLDLGSSIHDVHVNIYHKSSHDGLWEFWKKQAFQIRDWAPMFKYDPYFGTIPPGVLKREWLEKQNKENQKLDAAK
jgi:hypothetical protein